MDWPAEELEAGDSGLRSFVSVQGSLAMFPIATFGSGRAEAALVAEDGARRGYRLFWFDRARRLERSIRDEHKSTERRGWLYFKWDENVDYQWEHCRCSGSMGKDRGLGYATSWSRKGRRDLARATSSRNYRCEPR